MLFTSASRMPPPFKKRRVDTDAADSKLNGNSLKFSPDQRKNALRHKADHLLESRKKLPIWAHNDEIRSTVRNNNVVLLVGETGSGKSTQIPQFLVSESWCKPQEVHVPTKPQSQNSKARSNGTARKIGGRIAIIQPRRVAAISLATRVAAEVGTPLGSASPASTVGYSVRFDNNVSSSTKIKFLTDGMLLQELLRDPWLHDYSCVIVDEVHERGINVDLVLGFLRRILEASKTGGTEDGRHGVPLKVVVMSATAEMQSIETFFGQDELTSVAESNQLGEKDSGDAEWAGFSDEVQEEATGDEASKQSQIKQPITVSSCYIKGRQYPVTTTYTSTPVTNLLDAAMEKIIHLHQHQPLPGDVLVFLSGQEMIENLESLCHTYASTLLEKDKEQTQLTQTKSQKQKAQPKLPALQILPLFASLPTHLQSRIFQPTPHFTRRIILATNIAETSITVPGIRHVIDTGKHKSRLFRPGLNLDTLLSTPISQSMAKQRAGRAGREAPGFCHRLYTQKDYFDLEKDTKPEILSTDLAFLVLTLKAHGVNDVLSFPLLTKPPRRSLEAALEGLLNLNALDLDDGSITDTGRKMAMLPVRPDLARILLESTKHGKIVTEGVIDIVSALSLEEGIFLPIRQGRHRSLATPNNPSNPNASTKDLLLNNNKKMNGTTTFQLDDEEDHGNPDSDSDSDTPSNPIETARRTLLSRHSDHLTLLNTIQAYTSPTTHDRRAWCNEHGVSHRAMSRIMDVRKQLTQMLNNPKFKLPRDDGNITNETSPATSSTLSDMVTRETILKCLVAGLWTNVALLTSMAPSSSSAPQPHQQQVPQNPNQRAPYTTLLTGQGIHVHPSSVVFTQRGGGGNVGGKKGKVNGSGSTSGTGNMPRAIVFTDLVYTSKAYARNVSGVELAWIAERGEI